jgi:hypothetical protein
MACKHCGVFGGGRCCVFAATEQDATDEERAAVIVFVRKEAKLAGSRATTMRTAEGGRVFRQIAEALDRVADRIERGEHWEGIR